MDTAPYPGDAAALGEIGQVDSNVVVGLMAAITSGRPRLRGTACPYPGKAGRVAEARQWRAQAAARYDELLARHPEAFADHAAEFWLQAGADPDRALSLATRNLEVRPTPRAHELLSRATSAVDGARPRSLIPDLDGG